MAIPETQSKYSLPSASYNLHPLPLVMTNGKRLTVEWKERYSKCNSSEKPTKEVHPVQCHETASTRKVPFCMTRLSSIRSKIFVMPTVEISHPSCQRRECQEDEKIQSASPSRQERSTGTN